MTQVLKSKDIAQSTFDVQTFFDNFEMFGDASNAVAKMRELILQLAVQGKLVPQNQNDEPASAIVGRTQKYVTDSASRWIFFAKPSVESSTNVKSPEACIGLQRDEKSKTICRLQQLRQRTLKRTFPYRVSSLLLSRRLIMRLRRWRSHPRRSHPSTRTEKSIGQKQLPRTLKPSTSWT